MRPRVRARGRASRGSSAVRLAFDHGAPISRPDTLPILVFVMCLAATMIALGGRHTHALLVDLPAPYPSDGFAAQERPAPIRIGLSNTGIASWNGEPVTLAQLRTRLAHAARAPVRQPLQFDPSPDASYGAAAQLLGVIGEAGMIDECFRFMGAEKYRNYGRAPDLDAPEPGWTETCDIVYPMPVIVERRPEPPIEYFIW